MSDNRGVSEPNKFPKSKDNNKGVQATFTNESKTKILELTKLVEAKEKTIELFQTIIQQQHVSLQILSIQIAIDQRKEALQQHSTDNTRKRKGNYEEQESLQEPIDKKRVKLSTRSGDEGHFHSANLEQTDKSAVVGTSIHDITECYNAELKSSTRASILWKELKSSARENVLLKKKTEMMERNIVTLEKRIAGDSYVKALKRQNKSLERKLEASKNKAKRNDTCAWKRKSKMLEKELALILAKNDKFHVRCAQEREHVIVSLKRELAEKTLESKNAVHARDYYYRGWSACRGTVDEREQEILALKMRLDDQETQKRKDISRLKRKITAERSKYCNYAKKTEKEIIALKANISIQASEYLKVKEAKCKEISILQNRISILANQEAAQKGECKRNESHEYMKELRGSPAPALQCDICVEKYNEGGKGGEDRRPVIMPGDCGRSICKSCAEKDRASKIEDLPGNVKMIQCMFCRSKYHSEKHVFPINRDLMALL